MICWAPAQVYTEGMHLQAWAEPHTMVVTFVAATPLRLHLVGLHTQYANRSCEAMDVGGLANLTNLTCRPHRSLSRRLRLLLTWSCTLSNSSQHLVGRSGHLHLLCSYCAVKSRLSSMYKAWSTQITTESIKHKKNPCVTQVLNGPHCFSKCFARAHRCRRTPSWARAGRRRACGSQSRAPQTDHSRDRCS